MLRRSLFLACLLTLTKLMADPPGMMNGQLPPIYYEEPCAGTYRYVANSDPYFYTSNRTFGGFLWGNFCKRFSIEAAALYWKPSRDDRLYGLTTTASGSVQHNILHIAKPNFHWGWRVKAKYALPCCSFIDGEYTYFKPTSSDTTFSPIVNPFSFFNDPINQVTAHIKDFYQRARGRLGWCFCNGCQGSIYALGGVSWIYISEEDRLDALSGTTPLYLDQRSRFSGAGFEAGVGGIFNFLPCLGVKAEFNGIGAIGKRHHDLILVTNSGTEGAVETLINVYPTVTHVIPGLDVCLELFFTKTFFCPITLAIGWEHHHFFHPILLNAPFGFGGVEKAFLAQQVLDNGYGGLYLSLRLNY